MADPSHSKGAILVRKLAVDLTIMAGIGVILALIGPFGSFEVPFHIRLVVWLVFAFVGYAIYRPMGVVVERLRETLDLPRPGLWAATCMVATVPMTAVVWISNFFPLRPVPWPTLEQALTSYFQVLVIAGGVTAVFYLLEQRKNALAASRAAEGTIAPPPQAGAQAGAAPKSGARFLDRLPPSLGSDLLALEMEDHYVRAHTALGSELVLMRMRDAVAELDAMEGLQVHRSWWVARGAVEDVKREGRNVRLALSGDLEAPVSRANVAVLKEAGWI